MESPEKLIEQFWTEVDNAKLLLDYAVASGWKSEDNLKVNDRIIEDIQEIASETDREKVLTVENKIKFEKAYRDLSQFLAPVTAATLKATSNEHGKPRWAFPRSSKVSDAVHWSRLLAIGTGIFILLAVFHSWLLKYHGTFASPSNSDDWNLARVVFSFLDIMEPFLYGAIGACAYLLKTCHVHIYKRTFNTDRMPEYTNRIVLGLLSGGMIVLLINKINLAGGDTASLNQDVVALSAAALGFIAGYSTEFLFQAIERVMNAILPKVGVESVQTAQPRPLPLAIEEISLEALLERIEKAKDDRLRESLLALLDKINQRL